MEQKGPIILFFLQICGTAFRRRLAAGSLELEVQSAGVYFSANLFIPDILTNFLLNLKIGFMIIKLLVAGNIPVQWTSQLEKYGSLSFCKKPEELELIKELDNLFPQGIIISEAFFHSLGMEIRDYFSFRGIPCFVLHKKALSWGIPVDPEMSIELRGPFIESIIQLLIAKENFVVNDIENKLARAVNREVEKQKPEDNLLEILTPREKELILLIKKGLLYKEMADKMGLSISRISALVKSIFEKLGVTNLRELTIKLME